MRTKDAIKATAIEMIAQMDLNRITVKEIAERTGIHRKTFYIHYEAIELLMEDILRDIFTAYSAEMDKLPVPFTMLDVSRVFFTFFSQSPPYVERLILSPSYAEYYNRLHFQMISHNTKRYDPFPEYPQDEMNLIHTYLVNGLSSMYRRWTYDTKRVPLEQVIHLTGNLLEKGTSSLFHPEHIKE